MLWRKRGLALLEWMFLCCVLSGLTGMARTPVVPKTLHEAIVGNKQQLLGRIVTLPGFDIDARDSSGKTAMHYAAQRGDRRLVAKLLACAADVQLRDNDDKLAYDYIVGEGKQGIEQALLATRKFPRSRRARYNSERAAAAAILLKATVGTKGSDDEGRSPLHWAIWSGDSSLVRRLINEGAVVESEGIEVAMQMQNEHMLAFLVKAGASEHHVTSSRLPID